MPDRRPRPARPPRFVLVTCEHGGNIVPARWRTPLEGARGVLRTHRGLDRGAAAVARRVARRFGVPARIGRITRLVVDLNRTVGHPRCFSPWTRDLPLPEREAILETWYRPYRDAVTRALDRHVASRPPVFHLSVHSFTPVLRGHRRRTDIGLLYDPSRPLEASLARAWRAAIRDVDPALVVRRNHPYRGTDDGFIVALRARYVARDYAGLELEMNQKHFRSAAGARRMARVVCASLARVIEEVRGR